MRSLLLLLLLTTIPAIAQTPANPVSITTEPQLIKNVFRFDASSLKDKPRTVNLAGSFNHWSHTDTLMHDDGNNIYSITLELAPGLYHYKFLINGDHWEIDPAADKDLTDKEDNSNSGIMIGFDARKLPKPGPNFIEPRALAHDPASETDANVASSSLLRLQMRAQADDVQQINVWYRTPETPNWQKAMLSSVDKHFGFENFGGVISPSGSTAEYFFELIDGTAVRYLAGSALYDNRVAAESHPYTKDLTPTFDTPDWAKHATWYQIFVERFRNGDTSNDPPNTQRWQSKWYSTLPGEEPGQDKFYTVNVGKRRYGGDIQGVREELPYLRKLGITAIYLNPIFEADSSHKYDTRDYRHIDDYFGIKASADELQGETEDPGTWKWSKSDKLFLDFVQEAHRQGFKVVLDGVFNHVGKSHPFFQDVVKNGKNSRFADWFVILDWGHGGPLGKPGGIQYQGWEHVNGSLPILKKDPQMGFTPGPRAHVMAITRRWLAPDGDASRGIDGFRLDVAQDIPHPFWVEWRKLVKSINPQAYISGEIWSWAQPWLKGNEFDAVMNYQFATACQSFFVDQKHALSPSKFNGRLAQLYYNYPLQVVLAQMNLYDSHDTDRFASRFLNPDLGFDKANRLQDTGPKFDASKPKPIDWIRDHQAVIFQMTFAGSPMIYYGDEAGMWSPDDPSDRMPMWWKDLEPFDEPQYKFDDQEFAVYQRAIAVRQKLPNLQVGSFHPNLIDDSRSLYAFTRGDGPQTVYIALNRSSQPAEIKLSTDSDLPLINYLDPKSTEIVSPDPAKPESRTTLRIEPGAKTFAAESGTIQLSLPPFGIAILAPANP